MTQRCHGNRREPSVASLALTHGEVLWLFAELGFSCGVPKSTFNHYLKSLRKLGVPFAPVESKGKRRQAKYGYEQLMELALSLTLRVYGTLPDAVTTGLQKFRSDLYPIYRQAYHDKLQGLGRRTRIVSRGHRSFAMSGVYLDLQMRYSSGRLVEFGPPQALTPFEALSVFSLTEIPARAYLPLNLSAIATRLVESAALAPKIRRGPPKRDEAPRP